MRTDTTERALAVLLALTKDPALSTLALQAVVKTGKLRTLYLLLRLCNLGLIRYLPIPSGSLYAAAFLNVPHWQITNAGRHYLIAYDELDARAPYASFTEENQE